METTRNKFIEVHRNGKRLSINPNHIVSVFEVVGGACIIETDLRMQTVNYAKHAETSFVYEQIKQIDESYEQVIEILNNVQ